LMMRFGIDLDIEHYKENMKEFLKEGTLLVPILNSLKSFLLNSVNIVVGFISFLMIPVFYVYLVDHVDDCVGFISKMSPRHLKPTLERILRKWNVVLSGYIRGQLIVALALVIIYTLGFTLSGLKFGLTLGLLAGVFSCVPYLGAGTALLGSSIIIASTGSDFSTILTVLLTLVIAQVVESFYLSPKIVGNKVGLNPVSSMLSIIIGANLFGFVGVLIALPVGGMLIVVFEELLTTYKKSKFYY